MNRNFAVKILLVLAIVLQSFNAVSALLDAHQVDAEWPLSGPTKAQKTEAQKAWVIKRKRDKSGWIPPNAKALK